MLHVYNITSNNTDYILETETISIDHVDSYPREKSLKMKTKLFVNYNVDSLSSIDNDIMEMNR